MGVRNDYFSGLVYFIFLFWVLTKKGVREMNANEWAEMTKLTSEIMKLIEKNREQKEEIEFLKKEILAKHEDWKHEGQQAANARAEIEALKDKLMLAKQSLEIVEGWIKK